MNGKALAGWSAFHFGVVSIRQFLPENSIPGTLQSSATCTSNSALRLTEFCVGLPGSFEQFIDGSNVWPCKY